MTSRRLLSPMAKSLLDAADYIERHGHCKHAFEDMEGRVCILGALSAVGSNDCKTVNYLWNKISLRNGRKVREIITVVEWNDAPGRTAREIISTLRAAAIDAC